MRREGKGDGEWEKQGICGVLLLAVQLVFILSLGVSCGGEEGVKKGATFSIHVSVIDPPSPPPPQQG
jgi:hypothetical protein